MILTRDTLIAKIEERLAGRLDDRALAAWAFDQTYAFELEELDYDPAHEQLIDEVLDELVFLDDPSFRLAEDELRALCALLREPPELDEADED